MVVITWTVESLPFAQVVNALQDGDTGAGAAVLQGGAADQRKARALETERLQRAFALAEQQRVDASVRLAHQRAALAAAKHRIRRDAEFDQLPDEALT